MPAEVIPSSTMLPTTSVPGNGTTGAGSGATTTGGATGGATTATTATTTTKVGGAGAFGNTSADGTTSTKPVNGSKPTNGTSGNSSSSCFPGSSTVELQDGSVVRMDALSIGDLVKVSSDEFSRVFMFTHKLAESVNEFVVLSTSSGETLTVTSGHYIYINGVLSAASEAAVGSTLRLGSGASTTVTAVSSTVSTGLFNPQTTHGDIVVDGIVSSTYTTAVEPTVAHAILAPFRALYALTGFEMTAFESGAAALVGLAPRGTTAAL
jgi:Hint module